MSECRHVRMELIVPSDGKEYSQNEIAVFNHGDIKKIFYFLRGGGAGGGGVEFLGRESSRPNPFLKKVMLGNHPPATLSSATSC